MRPNLLFFLTDDQRHDMIGAAGHPVLQTPTIDRLAENGIRFTHAFVESPICAASRATFLTGLHARTHGYTFETPPLAARFIATSYPVLLRQAGYRTGFVGKLGVDISPEAVEMFDSVEILNRTPYFKPQPDGGVRHLTDITADRAVAFLQAQEPGQPFALSVSFNAPHAEDDDLENQYPFPVALAELYEDLTIDPPHLDAPEIFTSQPEFLRESLNRVRWHWRWDTPEKYQRNIKAYYRMITGVDRAIARTLDELKAQGLDGQTVIVFMADNGYYTGSRGFAGKWSHYDESLRVPLIVFDPRRPADQTGRTVPALVSNLDLAPTLLDLAGVEIPTSYEGSSLGPWLDGQAPSWRSWLFFEHLMEHPQIPKWEGVRSTRWSYANYFEQTPPYEFVHDLDGDPDQLRNLAHDHDEDLGDTLEMLRQTTEGLRP